MKVSAHQLVLQAKQAHGADPAGKFILLQLPADAYDGNAIEVNASTWPVLGCGSILALRLAMSEHANATTPVVLLYNGAENELGFDVLARCAKQRALQHDLWQTVLAMFRAAHIDPRLARHRWLAELLIRFMPADGYAPVRSLVLDQERAWKELFRVILGFENYPPSQLDLLQWAGDAQRRAQFLHLESAARDETVLRLSELLGDLAPVVFASIQAGSADELIAIAMLCESLQGNDASLLATAAKVAARLEVLFNGMALSQNTIAHLAKAAAAWLERASLEAREQQGARFEALVTQLKAEPLVARARFGKRALYEKEKGLAAAVNAQDLAAAQAQLQSLRLHRWPEADQPGLQRCEMALRLMAWLGQTETALPTSGLSGLALHYRNELAWVDWAQTVLLEGDDFADLANAWASLRERVRLRRDAFDEAFALALTKEEANDNADSKLLPIEAALVRCIGPVIQAGRALLILVDGMSLSVFLELHHSLREQGWHQVERTPDGCNTLLTQLPSTTEASRTSFFSGKAVAGAAANERTAFASHPALLGSSVAGLPPVLFHKRDLQDASGVNLSDEIRAAISDTRQRLVALVINAVDDHLMKSDQLRLRWDVNQFRGLDALLAEARSSDRSVIISSDHGHILDQDTQMVGNSPNARWREPNLESFPGEIRLSGKRVKAVTGLEQVVLAWNSRVRYAGKRNGYHGGCAPAEALVPLVTYRYGNKQEEGWSGREEIPPSWW